MPETADCLASIYQSRFAATAAYRARVWSVLAPRLARHFPTSCANVLDLGCGYGEWINLVSCPHRHGMDLNAASRAHLAPDIRFHEQDCSKPWPVPPDSLDAVITSNFFEHLPHKDSLRATLREVKRSLRPGGRLIAMGPNIRYLHGRYWDFIDHHVALSDRSIAEVLNLEGFKLVRLVPRFMPYTIIGGRQYPIGLVRLYLSCPIFWPLLGRQFLVVAEKI